MDPKRLDEIIERFGSLKIAVVGDFFVDRYLDIDPSLNEVSVETWLRAHQVVAVRSYPGAAANVANNVATLGVGSVFAVSAIGDDGEGYELRRYFEKVNISLDYFQVSSEIHTPTYTKPVYLEPDGAREGERLDIKNRVPLPESIEKRLIADLSEVFRRCDGVLICDQVDERELGLINDRVREELIRLSGADPSKIVLADSRGNIGLYRNVILKPNRREALLAAGMDEAATDEAALLGAGRAMVKHTARPIFMTLGDEGIHVISCEMDKRVPAYRPQGPIDIVGAGDSVAASVVSALCAGASLEEAALIGNLVGSITIEQIGVTGTASPGTLRSRLVEYLGQRGNG